MVYLETLKWNGVWEKSVDPRRIAEHHTTIMSWTTQAMETKLRNPTLPRQSLRQDTVQPVCQHRLGYLDIIPNSALLAFKRNRGNMEFGVAGILFHGEGNCVRFQRNLKGMPKIMVRLFMIRGFFWWKNSMGCNVSFLHQRTNIGCRSYRGRFIIFIGGHNRALVICGSWVSISHVFYLQITPFPTRL